MSKERSTVVCTDIRGDKVEVPINKLAFRPSVYGIVIKEGTVLLSSQWDGWDLPGGGIRMGEAMMDALVREIQEETGITVRPQALLYATNHFFTHPDGDRHFHTVLIYYACEYVSGELSTAGIDKTEKVYVREAVWMPLEAVANLKFYNQVDTPALIQQVVGLNAKK